MSRNDPFVVALFVLILTVGFVTVAAGGAAAQTGQQADEDGVPVVVTFEDHPAKNESVITQRGGRVTGGQGVDIAPVLFANVNENAIDAIQRNPGVAHVSRDVRVETFDQTTEWGVERVDGTAAASGVDESNVTVAVLDTGIDRDHEDLGENVVWGANTVGEGTAEGIETAEDGHGHGTHVAGIVAAADNDVGVVGVAPETSLYAMKALDDDGTGRTSDVIEAVDLAVKGPDGTVGSEDGADVVSMSFGAAEESSALRDALESAEEHAVLVAAAGNAGDGDPETDTVSYPAKYGSVIAVAATDRNDETPEWSSEGEAVELAAPGVDVRSTAPDDGYRSTSGTSMAAPHVSGAAALVIAADGGGSGEFDPALVRDRLRGAARDIEQEGTDTHSGYGLVNADGAVQRALAPDVDIVAPAGGETVSEWTSIRVDASGSQETTEIKSVEVAIDGGTWFEAEYNGTSGLYERAWNTSVLSDGQHTVTARATDSDGNTASESVWVQVANEASQPTVSFRNPRDGETVSDDLTVRIDADDNRTAPEDLEVFYRIDDREWVEATYDNGSGYHEARWSASEESHGTYTLTAYAVNEDGLEATEEIYVTVENLTHLPPGEQLGGIARIVQAELDGELEGRAFGHRIARAATEQERAEVVAAKRTEIETRLDELEGEGDRPERSVRMRTLAQLSDRSSAAAAGLSDETLAAHDLDREELNQLRRRAARGNARGSGPTARPGGGAIPADPPRRGGRSDGGGAERGPDRGPGEASGLEGDGRGPPSGTPGGPGGSGDGKAAGNGGQSGQPDGGPDRGPGGNPGASDNGDRGGPPGNSGGPGNGAGGGPSDNPGGGPDGS